MFKNKKNNNTENKNINQNEFNNILEEEISSTRIDNINEEVSEPKTDDGYVQMSFNLEPESDRNEDILIEDIDDESAIELVSKEDFDKFVIEINKTKNKSVRKTIVTSTLISSLVTASAFCGYNYLIKNNNVSTPSKIIVDGENKTSNVFKAVATKATPSVVGITTLSINTNNFFSLPTQTEGVGSGVIVDKNGYILTNSHVVDNGNATKVSVLFNDGTTSDGKVLWNDASIDLAIVKVEKTNLEVADLGDSDEVEVGDISIAIGNPIGLELSKSVTQGIISGKDRSLATTSGSNMTELLQTDASINPGNSGGPLLNEKGEVIGINTVKLSNAEGLGFAIPINIAKPIIKQIINEGEFEKVSLGIKGIDVDTMKASLGLELSIDKGVYIIEVQGKTPASIAGLRSGDIITKIDNKNIESMSDLVKALYKYKKGDSANITIFRDGEENTISVKFTTSASALKTEPKEDADNKDNTELDNFPKK